MRNAKWEFCKVDQVDRVLVVTIHRPEVLNAIHRPANLELERVFNTFATNPDLWVAIITGAGPKAFCAGNDLKYQAAGNDASAPDTGFGGLTARFDLDKPVIAAVNGVAMGAGFEIALACDLVVASENARFALPEPHVGLAATAGGLLRLPRQIHPKQAMGMVLTGRQVTAEEGFRLGFVNEVVPEGSALEAAKKWAEQILKGSPLSIRASKHLMYRSLGNERIETLYRAQKQYPAFRALYASNDSVEGPKAFAEKRKPVWEGR